MRSILPIKVESYSLLFFFFASFQSSFSQNAISPLNIVENSTYSTIGVQWNVSGDANYNSSLTIEYKKTSQANYNIAAKTLRANPTAIVDGAALNYNFHAGSALFLDPGTTYDLRLTLIDPDGGGTVQNITKQTKTEPPAFYTGTIKYVSPGNGGGTGTLANPYLGLQEAANNAQPGFVFQISPGVYSPFSLNADGIAGNEIVFSGSQMDSVIIEGSNTSSGIVTLGVYNDSLQHIVLENLVIQNGAWGIDAQNTQHILVRNCIIRNVNQGFVNRRANGWEHDQTISNNWITGRTVWPQTSGEIPGEGGIRIIGNRNVVRFNTVNNFGDGISTESPPYKINYSMDIHNNLVHRIVDDAIEIDGAVSNTRVWRNKCVNSRMGISLAPVFGGPCYVFRNEFMNLELSSYKMNRSPAGLVIAHNSCAKLDRGTTSSAGWQNTYLRNNLLASTNYCFEEFGLVSTSLHDDWDYNAYSTDAAGNLTAPWFKWNNVRYDKLPQLFTGTGIEQNGVEFNYHTDLINISFPSNWYTPVGLAAFNFLPAANSPLIDTGVALSNINDPFVTDGKPDCGALEKGMPLPPYGYQGPFLPTMLYEINEMQDECVIYPNPTNGVFQVSSAKSQILHLEIYTTLGKKIYSSVKPFGESIIDLNTQPGGLYICEFKTNDYFIRKKVMLIK